MANLSGWQLGGRLLLACALSLSPFTTVGGITAAQAASAASAAASNTASANPDAAAEVAAMASPSADGDAAANDASTAADTDQQAARAASAKRMVVPVNGALSASGSAPIINLAKPGVLDTDSSDVPGSGKNFLTGKIDPKILKGNVSKSDDSPFVEGKVQEVPKGTKVELTMMHPINSEFNQKGDDIWMKVAQDVVGENGSVMPGAWYMHGLVTEAQGRKRGNRDGYVEVQFDKIVSPDGKYEADFKATLSTKDSTIKSVAKQVFAESRYMAVGGIGGALISLQLTGIGGAVATHGISLGVGAGIGAGLGLFGSLKKFGDVADLSSGDHMRMTIVEPLQMPVFKARTFVAAKPVPKLATMDIKVNAYKFDKNPSGDKRSKRLQVDVTIVNHTNHNVKAGQLSVVNDFDQQFEPVIDMNLRDLMKPIQPYASEHILIVYEVGDAKRKYWLSLHDNSRTKELARVPVNTQN